MGVCILKGTGKWDLEVIENKVVSILKKLGFWFSALVIFPGILFFFLFPDFFYPETPWETGTKYNYGLFENDPDSNFYDHKIDIIALYEDVQGGSEEVYGVQPTLFSRTLVHAIEDREQIGKFLRFVNNVNQGLKGSTNCFIQDGQKEIHVVTFDYTNNKAGYFVMHFCKVNDQYITMLKFLDDNWTAIVWESLEMTEFLDEIGITP